MLRNIQLFRVIFLICCLCVVVRICAQVDSEELSGPETSEKYEEELIGEQGNWTKKRKVVEDSLDVIKSVQDLVANIQGLQEKFQESFSEMDKELDVFYMNLGIDRGKALSTLDEVTLFVAKRKKKEIEELKKVVEEEKLGDTYYDYKVSEIEDEVSDMIRDLEQLRRDVISIEDLDASLGQRVKKVDEHIEFALSQIEKAHTISNDLWRIIDHKKAEERFYEIKEVYEYEKARKRYIEQDLFNDFESVSRRVRDQITQVEREIHDLEKRGLIIKNRSERIRILQEEQRKKHLEEALQKEKPYGSVERSRRIGHQRGFFSRVMHRCGVFIDGVFSVVSSLFF